MIPYKNIITSFILFFIIISFFQYSFQLESNYIFQKDKNNILVSNDFSNNPSNNWILLNAAYWDSKSENIVLTEPGSELVGVMWLKNNVSIPITVEFSYIIGGGSGADGMVFMFYKDWDYDPGIGGFLGFHCRDVGVECPRNYALGYGIEFDNYYNSKQEYGDIYGDGDPSPNHIALIKDFIGTHITYVNDSRTEDNVWHHVKLIIKNSEIILFIDGEQTLVWNGYIDRSNNHIGFGSGIWGYDHKHIIDDFKLYGNTITINGLYPNWNIKLISNDSIVSESKVLKNENKSILDVSGLDFPIKGYFKIYSESDLIFVSSIIDEIWGGDEWSIMPNSSDQTLIKVNELNWDLPLYIIIVGFTSIILIIFLIINKRKIK